MRRARDRRAAGRLGALLALLLVLLGGLPARSAAGEPSPEHLPQGSATNASVVGNFSAALSRLVTLLAAGGGGLLALVWARVALSWFSNDVTKKVQAKERARDALIGTLVFTAAVSGLAWALAQWVISGS
jgi:hypothetical protein